MENTEVKNAWRQLSAHVPGEVIRENCVAAPSLDHRYNTMSMFLEDGEFVGSLRDLMDERKTIKNRWNVLIDVKGSFQSMVECCQIVSDVVQIRILNVYKWNSCISQLKNGDVFVRTEYKDLQHVKRLSIVHEVWTAGRVIFDFITNGTVIDSISVYGPVPIAYNTLNFSLHSNGALGPTCDVDENIQVPETAERKFSRQYLREILSKRLPRKLNLKS